MFALFILIIGTALLFPYFLYLALFQNTLQENASRAVAHAMINHNAAVYSYCVNVAHIPSGMPCTNRALFGRLSVPPAPAPIEAYQTSVPLGILQSPLIDSGAITSFFAQTTDTPPKRFVVTYLSDPEEYKNLGIIVDELVRATPGPNYYSGFYDQNTQCVMGEKDPTKAPSGPDRPLSGSTCAWILNEIPPPFVLRHGIPLIIVPL